MIINDVGTLTLPSLKLVRQAGNLPASRLILGANICELPLDFRVLTSDGTKLFAEPVSVLLGVVTLILSGPELRKCVFKINLDAVAVGLMSRDGEVHLSDPSTNALQFVVTLRKLMLALADLVESSGELDEESLDFFLSLPKLAAMVVMLAFLSLESLGDFINTHEEFLSLLLEALSVRHQARPILFEGGRLLGSIGHQLDQTEEFAFSLGGQLHRHLAAMGVHERARSTVDSTNMATATSERSPTSISPGVGVGVGSTEPAERAAVLVDGVGLR